MNPKLFKACLVAIVFITLALLFPHSPSLGVNKTVRLISRTQEKGGVVKPTPTPKPRSAPSPSTRTSTTSGISRRTTVPAKPRQIGLPIEMVLIPVGTFMMGSPDGVGLDIEHPQHQVSVQSFYMGKYEVTQAQYRAVMGSNPSYFTGCDECPVDNVTWNDAQKFIRKLNEMNGGYTYRLPTEAEWEYACRAGTTGDYAGNLNAMAWYGINSRHKTHPVGTKQANGFGLYDMHGNVFEWCEDIWHRDYNGAPRNGSAWLRGDSDLRVLRGGSWDTPDPFYLRSADRGFGPPDEDRPNFSNVNGFRVVAFSRSS